MSYSWFLDSSIPVNQKSFPTQATAFGSSSLAAASKSYLVVDKGSQEPELFKMTDGNRHQNNLTIFSNDKSSLGVETRERASKLMFRQAPSRMVTVPNVESLSRNTLLQQQR